MSSASASGLSCLPVAILCGGLATRLRPLTEVIPKSLVPIRGEPFLAHQIRLLRGHGFQRLILCVGHLGEMIQEQFGAGEGWGVELKYSFDGDVLLGTGGALRRAPPLLGPRFAILYGDSYLRMDYAAALGHWRASGKRALMSVFHNQGRFDASNVWFEGGQIRVYDKVQRTEAMHYIDHGLGIMRADVLQAFPEGEAFDLATVYRNLAQEGDLAGFEAQERFYEIGSHAGIADLEQVLAEHGGAAEQGAGR